MKSMFFYFTLLLKLAHKHEGAFGNNNTRRQGDVEDADCNIMFEMLNNGPWTVEVLVDLVDLENAIYLHLTKVTCL